MALHSQSGLIAFHNLFFLSLPLSALPAAACVCGFGTDPFLLLPPIQTLQQDVGGGVAVDPACTHGDRKSVCLILTVSVGCVSSLSDSPPHSPVPAEEGLRGS